MSINEHGIKDTSQNLFIEMMPRGIVALIASAVIPAITFFVGIFLFFTIAAARESPSENLVDAARYGISVAMLFGFVALIASAQWVIFLGIPASILGWRLGFIRWWSSISVGVILGYLPLIVLAAFPEILTLIFSIFSKQAYIPTFENLFELNPAAFVFGIFGAIGGFSFWLVWRFWNRSPHIMLENNIIQ